MKELQRIAQKHWILTVCLLFILFTLTVYSFAQLYVSATTESRADDQYDYLMSNNRITDLDVLIDEVAYYQFGALPPLPGIAPWDHHIEIYPVDWENFPEEMTSNLIGYWEGDVPVYDLYIFQDQETREIVFLNSDRTEIYSIPCPYLEYCDPATYALERRPDLYSGKYSKEEIAYYIAHRDPARLGIWITLVPTKDLYAYLYTRAANDSLLQALKPVRPPAGGGALRSSGGSNEMEIIAFQHVSGLMKVTVAWPVTFTNRIDIYSCDGGDYAGFGSWVQADSCLVTLGTNMLQWVDNGQLGRSAFPANETVRFYSAGNADDDQDGDGYSSAYEQFVLNTDPASGDTDGDGISDGPFDPDNNGPIVAGPDPAPLNSNVVADTDGDGIGDSTDPDDDNDGLADGSDPDSLNPITIARFKIVTVNAPGSSFASTHSSMTVVGNFTDWDVTANNMRLVANHTWEYITSINENTPAFKFAANGSWTTNWGESNQSDFLLPLNGTAESAAGNIVISNSLDGLYQFTFNETSLAYSVEATSGTDSGDEVFDVSSSGRMLPYASGGDARGFGKLHGGIYFNNDGTNLYIGIAGFEKNGDNVLMLFIDADGTSTGVSSLTNVSTGPSAFSGADNLSFDSTNFVPEIGILVGNRFAKGRNYPDMGSGQGVYSLSPTAATGFSGFDLKTGAISQWGDRGTNSANAGIEIALSLSSLGLSTGDIFKAAAIIAGGASGLNRWFSGETYGESVSGTLSGNDFGDNAVTLIGAQVYISDVEAPAYGGPPPFTDDDVMLQGYYWDVPFESGHGEGTWYDRVRGQAESNELDKFTMIWMPPPQKCDSNTNSVGYDPFDYYDLGTYNEKFTTETRYGSEAELQACISALKSCSITPIIDLVFNHNKGGYSTEGGTGTLNFAYGNHDTFEKIDTTGTNSSSYYNDNSRNEPFQFETDFGPDVNVSHWYQRQGLKNWGNWVSAKAAYGGYRWDYTQGIEPWFVAEFMNYGLMKGRFSVMEYWMEKTDSTVQENLTWLALTDYRSAMFDMLLHTELENMCNLNGTFDMSLLVSVGLVNANPAYTVTFPESHDTIRPYGGDDKTGILKDKLLAYAFALISQGLPMVAYNDYFIGPNADPNPPNDPVDDGWTGTPLKSEIDDLIDARREYAGGSSSYLSQSNKTDLFIVKRSGNAEKPGCILVINDHTSSTLSDTVATGWISTNLVDVLNTNHTVVTDDSGYATLNSSSRWYRVYVPEGEL